MGQLESFVAAAVAYDTSLVNLLSSRVFVLVNQILIDVFLDKTVALIRNPSVNKSVYLIDQYSPTQDRLQMVQKTHEAKFMLGFPSSSQSAFNSKK